MKLADSHIHLFRGGFPGRYGPLFPAGDEIAIYERIRGSHSVETALVVGYEGAEWSRGNNRYLATLAKRSDWIVPLAFSHVCRPPKAGQIISWHRDGFAGTSIYVSGSEDAKALCSWPEQVLGELNSVRAILSINCPAGVVDGLRPFLEALPEARILLSHLGLPGRMEEARKQLVPVLELADITHLWIKLSGAYACNGYPHPGLSDLLDALRDTYGERRLCWGSDFSPALDSVTFSQTINAIRDYPWQRPADIFGNNLRRAIGLVHPKYFQRPPP